MQGGCICRRIKEQDMDLSRIFLKDACPTSIGGQAVMEGVMMKGPDRTAVCVRIPDGRLFIRTKKNRHRGKFAKLPLIRGVVSFIASLIEGTKILTWSADVLEFFSDGEEEEQETGRFERWLERHFSEQTVWNFMLSISVILALLFSVAVFILFPTVAVNWLEIWIKSSVLLNLIEGIFRIFLLVLYIWLVSKMEDIKRVFRYHGAEHKTIHCFENGLELTPENARQFYTLHPRCGTSFLMFVAVVSLLLFSLLGWPSMLWRILSRILLLPAVAAISYEILRWAGRSDNKLVEILSLPGLYLQKLTTSQPDDSMLEVAIAAMKAVLVPQEAECIEGICDKDGHLIEAMRVERDKKET